MKELSDYTKQLGDLQRRSQKFYLNEDWQIRLLIDIGLFIASFLVYFYETWLTK